MKITDRPLPHFNERRGGNGVSFLILHYTGTKTSDIFFEDALRKETSAHYLVDEAGGALRLVDEGMRAWHAGKSFWAGEEDLNSRSVGIEVQNPGHEWGYVPFAPAQVEAVIALCRDIIARHGISPRHVLAHSDIAPARKIDPGELFPWKELAAAGVGLWPEVREEDRHGAVKDVAGLLSRHGYDHRLDLSVLLPAFRRHFRPEMFAAGTESAAPELDDVYILNALLRRAAD